MQFKRMLLMCSALITLAHSFPTDMQKIFTSLNQNSTTLLNSKENEKPLVLIMEEKNPSSDSVVVQFVYTSNAGNSRVLTIGSEKDKYVIENSVEEQKNNENLNENEKNKLVQISNTYKTTQRQDDKGKSDIPNTALTSLVPEEVSPLSFKWQKDIFDTFNPIKPFPELELQKPNQIITDIVTKENKTYISNNGEERREIPFVAGPQLSPLSIYDRELYVPIFD